MALGDAPVDGSRSSTSVTVNNPSCTDSVERRRRALLEVARRLSRQQGRRIPIFYDLAYELLLHDPPAEPFVSVLPEDDLGIAYEIGTLSKVLAPGLRIGYLLGPDGPLMNAMVQKTSDAGFSAPLFVQEMASFLLDRRITEQLRRRQRGLSREGGGGARGHRGQPGPDFSKSAAAAARASITT
jgi:2-aminoadipate transaminase